MSSHLYELAKELMNKNNETNIFKRYVMQYEVPEHLKVSLYRINTKDGTGKILENELIYIAERADGSIIELSAQWLLQSNFDNSIEELPILEEDSLKKEILMLALKRKNDLSTRRNEQLQRLYNYLKESFENQFNDTYDKLMHYQLENKYNKNSALINQMNAQLLDIEEQKGRRLDVLNKQKTISLQPPKLIAQFELIPNGRSQRLIAEDYYDLVKEYEKANGRKLVKMYNNLSLVDYYSERFNGEERFIIITNSENYILSEEQIEDLKGLTDMVYVYVKNESEIIENQLLI